MAGYDFTYTIGMNAEFTEATRKVEAFNKDLQSRNFDIKLDLAGYDNVGEVEKQLKKLGITTQELKNVTVETKTFIDAQGRSHQEVTKLVTDHINAYGKLEKVTTVVNSKYKETQDSLKKYDNLLKSTDTTLQGLQNVEGKHKDAIQKTATELNSAVSKWKGLAEQYGVGSAEAKKAEAEIDRLSKTIKEQTGATKTGAAGLQSWATTAQRVIKQSFAYAIAMRAIRIAQQELNKAIKFTVDLNTEMTNIRVLQVEGAKTAAEINNLAESFNRLAQEMGATTLEVAKGSVEWLRQGKTIEETGELLRSTIMLSKLGNLSAADSTKYLTSTLNGYKMEAEEAVAVVDKLVAVDNVAATSVAELATALQYSAAIANETGVSFEQLVSYIATVSETTRQNAESIGQGMKTMLTRMQDIKGGKLDEDSLGINNVEIALRRADVKLRDSKNSFRDFGGVLEELAGKWDGLTETEQAFIAKSIAGIRQVNMFTVLMQNMGRAIELQEVQLNSAGMSMERYQLYMESLQAKMSVFKATLEGLYQSAISSGLVEWFVELGTSILEFIETIGGLKNALGAAGLIVVLIKVATHLQQITKLVYTLQWLKAASIGTPILKALGEAAAVAGAEAAAGSAGFTALAASIGATVAVAAGVIAVLGILAYGISKAVHTTNELAKEVRTLNTEISDLGSKNTSAEDLQKQYNELTIELSGLTEGTDEYAKKQQELYDVQNRLKSLFPELLGYYDAEGNFIITNNDLIQEQIDKLLILIELKKKAAEKAAREGLFKTGSLEPTGEKRTYVDPVTKQPFEQSVFEFSRGEGKYADFAAAFNKAAMGGDDTDYQSFITLLQDALPEDLNAFVDGASEYFAGVDVANEEGMLTTLEQIRELINQGNEQEKADKAAADVAKQNKENLIQYGGYNETQAENQIKYGDDSLAQIIGGELPSAIALFKDFDAVLEKVSKNEIIPDDVILKLGALGVEYRILDDGTQQFYRTLENGTKDVVNSTDMLIDAKMAEIDENWMLSGAQKEVVRSYLEAGYAAEEQERALQKLNEEYEKTLSVSNLVAEAINEQSENQSISEETALALVAANGELENYITKTADGYTFASNEARNFANSQLIAQFAALQAASAESESAVVLDWLVKAQEAASQGNYYLAQSMLASASAAGLSTDALAQYTGIVSQLSQLSGAGFGVSSGGSGGGKQENPAIKENEELIEQIEEQIELKEDEIDAYKKEIDLIKEAQDQYHDWLDQKKKSLELTKEENDYFKEQQKSLKELADIRKRIAELEFDTSEEARAKRQELEAEAAKMEEDIAENADDRRHDQQMEALDALKDSYDRMIDVQIKGIEDIITGIEDSIGLLRDQIDDIRDIIEDLRDQGRSGGGSGYSGDSGGTYNPNGTNNQGGWTTDPQGHPIFINPNEGILQEPFNPNGTHANQNSVDYAMDAGSNVAAEQTGVIKAAWVGKDYGETMVLVDPKSGIATQYYHLAPGTVAKYKDQVGKGIIEAGQVFAQTGITGNVGDIAHLGVRKGEWDSETGRLVQTEEINKYYRDLIDLGIIPTIDALSDFALTSIPQANQSVTNFGVKVVNATGKVDEELTATANSLAENGVLTQQGFENVEEALRSGGITLDDGISGVMEDLAYLGIGAGLTGQGLIELYQFIMDSAKNISEGGDQTTFRPFVPSSYTATGDLKPGFAPDTPRIVKHDGGLVESHHDGEFAGGLQSNEVFAKLLKGEYVATEHQMDNFLRNVLPSIGSNMPKVTSNIGGQNINVSMPITVEGNLDKSVIPDIKNIANQVIAEINRSLISRGYVRPANQSLS